MTDKSKLMEPFADYAALLHHYCADQRVGTDQALTKTGQSKCPRHVFSI